MFTKKLFHSVLALIMMLTIIITIFPTAEVSAKAKPQTIKSFCTNEHDDEWEPHAQVKNYLVLIGQADGTYAAYDDIAFVTSHDKVMVKANPLATALGLTYQNTSGGHGRKKGCVLTLGNKKNVYLRNSKTFYYYDNTTKYTKTAEYKQYNNKSNNLVHCATLSTLVNFQYYDTLNVPDYENLGYRGVVVYNKYSYIAKLPDIKNVTRLPINDNDGHDHNGDAVTNIKVTPVVTYNNSYGDVKFIEASYSTTKNTVGFIGAIQCLYDLWITL